MSLIELANSDINDITTDLNGWGVGMVLTAPNATTLACVGLHTKHRSGYDSEGLQVNTKNAHISISEDVFIAASYPYRVNGEVNLKDHLVTVKDSTRADIQYIIREWFQDETIGCIVCILGDYEGSVNPVPLTPTALTATLVTDLYGVHTVSLAWVDTTAGDFDTYEIWRSVDGGAFALLNSTANPIFYDDVFSDAAPHFYSYKVLAVKNSVDSLFSNEDGVLTLVLSGDVFALTATLYALNIVDLAWTDATLGNYDTYEIWRSENSGAYALLDTTANPTSYRDLDNLYENEVKNYKYKVRAVLSAVPSIYSNEDGALTLKVENIALGLDASNPNDEIVTDSLRVVSALDSSEGLAETNVYTSDYPTTVAELAGTNTALTANETAPEGTTGCLKGVLIGGSTTHRITPPTLTAEKNYRVRARVYIPSTNSHCDGFFIKSNSQEYIRHENTVDQWVDVDFNGTLIINSFQLRGLDGSTDVINADGDEIFIEYWIHDEIEGNHLVQVTDGQRPLKNGSQYEFDSNNSEYLSNSLDIDSFSGLNQGGIFYINDQLSTAMLTICDSSVSNNYINLGHAGGKARIQFIVNGVITRLDSVISIVENDRVLWYNDKSGTVKCRINGIESGVTVNTGTNQDIWFSSFSGLDSLAIGGVLDSTPVYTNQVFKELILTTKPISETLSLAISQQWAVKHNL